MHSLPAASVVVNAAQYHVNLAVMEGALRSGCHYLDLGGLFHTTRRQLELGERFEEAQLSAVLGIGSCPGIANVHAGDLGARLEQVRSVRIFNGATVDPSDRITWPYSLWTILDEVTQRPVVFREGEFVEVEPLSEEEPFPFLEPIGHATTHLSLHSEVATIPVSLAAKGIERCEFKIRFFGLSEPALRKLAFLASIGLASTDPRTVGGRRGSRPPPPPGRPARGDHPTSSRTTPGSRTSPPWPRARSTVYPPGSGWTQPHGHHPSSASAGARSLWPPPRRGRPLAGRRRPSSRCPPPGDRDRTRSLLRRIGSAGDHDHPQRGNRSGGIVGRRKPSFRPPAGGRATRCGAAGGGITELSHGARHAAIALLGVNHSPLPRRLRRRVLPRRGETLATSPAAFFLRCSRTSPSGACPIWRSGYPRLVALPSRGIAQWEPR